MDHITEGLRRKLESSNIPGEEPNSSMPGQVRRFLFEGFRRAGEDGNADIQSQFVVRPEQAFKQPATEKTCSSGQKNALSPEVLPQALRMGHNVVEVFFENISHGR